jgi:hypothetical protein
LLRRWEATVEEFAAYLERHPERLVATLAALRERLFERT